MTKTIIGVVIGGAIGATAGYFYAQRKLQERYKEDLEDIKREYKKASEIVKPVKKEEPKEDPIDQANKVLTGLKYAKPTKKTTKKKNKLSDPFVIGTDESGNTGYSVETLTYYLEDGVLADEFDEIIDADGVVGVAWISITEDPDYRADHDAVYVRNDSLKKDYEIVLDERSYEDVCGPIEEE